MDGRYQLTFRPNWKRSAENPRLIHRPRYPFQSIVSLLSTMTSTQRSVKYWPIEINKTVIYNQMSWWQLGNAQHCLSAVKSVGSFTDCVLATLNLNDEMKRLILDIHSITVKVFRNIAIVGASCWHLMFRDPLYEGVGYLVSLVASSFHQVNTRGYYYVCINIILTKYNGLWRAGIYTYLNGPLKCCLSVLLVMYKKVVIRTYYLGL